MAKLNVMKAINENRSNINPKYDLGTEHMEIIRNNCVDKFDLVCNFFVFGYVQGRKAAKAEMKNTKVEEKDDCSIIKKQIKQYLDKASEKQLKAICSFAKSYLK